MMTSAIAKDRSLGSAVPSRIAVVGTLACIAIGASCSASQEPAWFPGSTVKVCQLTGDFDAARRLPTASLTRKRFGIIGTDLGSSFEHEGRLWFLFGDTAGRPGFPRCDGLDCCIRAFRHGARLLPRG